jgi:hypothetical protein
MRVVETLQDLVLPNGTIGIMSSGQGSIANNENGNYEVYRGSKARTLRIRSTRRPEQRVFSIWITSAARFPGECNLEVCSRKTSEFFGTSVEGFIARRNGSPTATWTRPAFQAGVWRACAERRTSRHW